MNFKLYRSLNFLTDCGFFSVDCLALVYFLDVYTLPEAIFFEFCRVTHYYIHCLIDLFPKCDYIPRNSSLKTFLIIITCHFLRCVKSCHKDMNASACMNSIPQEHVTNDQTLSRRFSHILNNGI